MIDIQEKLGEQLEQFTKYQKAAFEVLQSRGSEAADNYEKIARYNLEVMSDLVDYTVEQSRLATGAQNPEEFVSKHIDNASAFAKVVEARTKEFVDLFTSAAAKASDDIQAATKETVIKAVSKKSA